MTVVPVVDSGLGNSAYVVDLGDGGALIVDPQRDPRPYVAERERRGLTLRWVVETHLHADFVSGGRELAAAGAALAAPVGSGLTYAHRALHDGEEVDLGGLTLQAIATPGHTPESLCLLVTDGTRGPEPWFLLTGDTLFVYSVGRPDLGGQAATLVDGLYRTLFTVYGSLADEVEIYPTHYTYHRECSARGVCVTTLGEARRTNEALQIQERESFTRHILDDMPPAPANYEKIRLVNMGRHTISEDEARESEIGPNRCAARR